MNAIRVELDSLGPVNVPGDKLWGAQGTFPLLRSVDRRTSVLACRIALTGIERQARTLVLRSFLNRAQ
jgi:hypothetical protein